MNKKVLASMTTVMVVLLVLTICAVFYATLSAAQNATADVLTYVHALAYSLTGLFAIYYILAGCKKDGGAKYFTWFMIAYALCCILLYFRADEMDVADSILNCLVFGALCVLSMAKDLGQKKSTALSLVVLIIEAVCLLKLFLGENFAATYPAPASNLVFALNVLFMVTAKYYDKASRGSK